MSTYRIPDVNNLKPQIVDGAIWGDVRFDASDNLPNYIGMHVTRGADQGATDWKILKFSYSGSNVTRIETAYGSYTGRAGLFP